MAHSPLWLIERVFKNSFFIGSPLVAIAVSASYVSFSGGRLRSQDWLFVSGIATWLAAIYFTLLLPDRVDVTLERLYHTKVISGPLALKELQELIQGKAKRAAAIGAALLPVVLTLAFGVALRGNLAAKWILLVEEAAAVISVGFFFGRVCSYGRLGHRLEMLNFKITPDPGHLDGAAGLRPVGRLFFHQATLLAIPAMFLATWWVLIPVVDRRYLIWREPYVGLLAFVLVIELLAFFAPMLTFHRIMLSTQRSLFREADLLSYKIVAAQQEAAQAAQEGKSPDTADLEAVLARYQAIEKMPTWPVDNRLRRNFGIRNIILFVPIAVQVFGASQDTQDLLEWLQKTFTISRGA